MKIVTNQPYPNRIQWILENYLGPFAQQGPLGDFDPRRDLEVYVDGTLIPVRSFVFIISPLTLRWEIQKPPRRSEGVLRMGLIDFATQCG